MLMMTQNRRREAWNVRWLIAPLMGALLSVSIQASSPISIESKQMMGNAPATFRIRIMLEPDERNRVVCLQVGDERRSCWTVQAEKEARTTWRELRDLRSGEYEVRAYIIRNDEQIVLSNTLTLTVIGI